MNSDVYIFGKLGSYYSQYPDDFTSEFFMKMGEWYTPVDTYISVHRRGELMYYGYVRKLKADRYIGFCSVLNGMMVTDLNALFDVFDSMLNHLAVGGEILKYSDSGEIVANTQSLVYGKPILNQVRALLKDGLSGLSTNLKGLPPESYGISVNESKQFDLHTDDMSQIVSASWSYSYTFIAKDSGTPAPNSYQGVLRRLHKEKKVLEVTNADLLDQVLKLKKEKKQQGVVFTVSAAAIICFFVLLGVKQSLDEAQDDLALSQKKLENTQAELDQTRGDLINERKQKKEMETELWGKILNKDREIISLQEQNEQMDVDLNYYKNELQQAETEIRNLKKSVNQSMSSYSVKYTSGDVSKATTIVDAPLRTGSHQTASIKMNIPKGTTIDVFINEYRNGYYKIRYGQTIGYMSKIFFIESR